MNIAVAHSNMQRISKSTPGYMHIFVGSIHTSISWGLYIINLIIQHLLLLSITCFIITPVPTCICFINQLQKLSIKTHSLNTQLQSPPNVSTMSSYYLWVKSYNSICQKNKLKYLIVMSPCPVKIMIGCRGMCRSFVLFSPTTFHVRESYNIQKWFNSVSFKV